MPVGILAEVNFFFQRDAGAPDLFHTVGTVGVKIREAQKPAIVKLNLMGNCQAFSEKSSIILTVGCIKLTSIGNEPIIIK